MGRVGKRRKSQKAPELANVEIKGLKDRSGGTVWDVNFRVIECAGTSEKATAIIVKRRAGSGWQHANRTVGVFF